MKSTPIIDFEHAEVFALAMKLGRDSEPELVAQRCFEWVRDTIRHSLDHKDECVTISASEVIRHGTGLCYSKSHLLAALLRANGIPCGLVYQRLALDESGKCFCLHSLNAVWLPMIKWYRMDARGNREGISTHFNPPIESLAFKTSLDGEGLIDKVFADPLPVVVAAMSRHPKLAEFSQNLPDWICDPP